MSASSATRRSTGSPATDGSLRRALRADVGSLPGIVAGPSPTSFAAGPEAFRRALAHVHAGRRQLAGDSRDVAGGFVLRTADLPLVWSLNALWVTGPLDAAAVEALADATQDDLPYRHVVVGHEETAAAVAGPLTAAGWRMEREVFMALGRPPPVVAADDPAVVELDEAAMLGLMARWLVEDHPAITPAGLAQVQEYSRREGRLYAERRLGVRAPDGTALAVTKVRLDGPVGWVEDVYTLPEARRRGHARRLVTRATALAAATGPEMVFIVADDDDWPQHLYAEVGFVPVGRTGTFHREAAGP